MNELTAKRYRDYGDYIVLRLQIGAPAPTLAEAAEVLGVSRFALMRARERYCSPSSMERPCELCGEPIPWPVTARRRFCKDSHRAKAWRLRRPNA
jgi:hypothetical protein